MNRLNVRLREKRLRGSVRREASFDGRSVWWDISGAPVPELQAHDMAVPAMVHLAMHEGRNLHVDGPVTRSLLEGMEDYTSLWAMWRPNDYRRIGVTAAETVEDAPSSGKAVAAYSGGVDATFTLWRHRSGLAGLRSRDISHAALIHGFDIPLDNVDAFAAAEATARETLESVQVPLAIVRTNWRHDVCLDWEMEFGAGLSAALRNWQSEVGSALVGSDEDYSHLVSPWGSHPIPFQMMSSADFRVVYDAGEFTRSQKVAALAEWPEAMQNLRVCWEGAITGRNCGHCEKCVRTKLNFLAAGLPLPASLDGAPHPKRIRKLRARNDVQLAYLEEIATMAQTHGRDGPWLDALRRAIGHNRFKSALRRIPAYVATRDRLKAVFA